MEEKNIYFLLKVKCPVIASDIGAEVGTLVLQRSDAGWAHEIAHLLVKGADTKRRTKRW